MKLFLAAIAFLFSSQLASARVNWQGEIMFLTANSPCVADGWGVGSNFLSNFLPSGISNNGPDTYISFMQQRNAYSNKIAGRPGVAPKSYSGVEITSAGSFFSVNGVISNFRTQPATITATTPYIFVSGTLTNFAGNPGCVVTFHGAYVRRR